MGSREDPALCARRPRVRKGAFPVARNFDYERAAADLFFRGCPQPDEVFLYDTEIALCEFLRRYDLYWLDYYYDDD